MRKSDGYILDMTYPIYFYKEMQPLWLKTIFAILGFKTRDIEQSFSYLELGCARGINLIIAAMHYPQGQFVGIDFNPAHIKQAKQFAKQLNLTNVEFIEIDFQSFIEKNTTHFDYIVNHGTFSWVSPVQQEKILQICAQFLKEQGIFYLHYMCYPGSIELQPIQKLLNLVDQRTGKSSIDAIRQGKQLFTDLHQAGAFLHQAKIEPIVNTLKQSDEYLAHEFLTNHWQPFYSVDVHQRVFESSHMTYMGSANPCNNIDSISIPGKLQKIISETADPALKEYIKDIARDAKQRIDIFQKMPIALDPQRHLDTLKSIVFTKSANMPSKNKRVFKTAIGDIPMELHMIDPIFIGLKEQNMTFADLMLLEPFKHNLYFLIETISLLMSDDYIYPILNQNQQNDSTQIQVFNKLMHDLGMKLQLSEQSTVVM